VQKVVQCNDIPHTEFPRHQALGIF